MKTDEKIGKPKTENQMIMKAFYNAMIKVSKDKTLV